MQPDLTDIRTLRPKWKPLQKNGDEFILIYIPKFSSKVMLLLGITLLDTSGNFHLILSWPNTWYYSEKTTNNCEGKAHGP
jgi:hypothetical protein